MMQRLIKYHTQMMKFSKTLEFLSVFPSVLAEIVFAWQNPTLSLEEGITRQPAHLHLLGLEHVSINQFNQFIRQQRAIGHLQVAKYNIQ